MTYHQFVQEVEGKVREGITENVSVNVHTATKNNGRERKGLILAECGVNISPAIYLEEYFQQFCEGSSIDAIAGDILRLYREVRFGHSFDGQKMLQYDYIREKIIFHLINREKNSEMLMDVPYDSYLDLAVVYYVLIEVNQYGTASMLINNEHMNQWNVSKKEISIQAHENTEKLLPYEFQTMNAVLEQLGVFENPPAKDTMYVLSNQIRSYGAAAVLYKGRLEGIGEYLKENYYVLPSSVHEVIIVPESEAPGKKELVQIVTEINSSQVEEEELLADNAYYYDRSMAKLMDL